ncbi:hypothetical protein [Niallia sp. 03133]|uniref:hypothetical protein n=1 Tax=Niallia sp. 03133 TaxID=3458060 RepID=UPI00404408C2
MNSLHVLIKKEFVQMVRDFKVIWLPIIFIFLGITQPIVTYYLPSILNSLSNGQGITIDPSITNQKGETVLASTLGSQFDQLGIILLAISIMSVIQVDKANGMLSFILSRPVTVFSYIGSKIISSYLLTVFSIVIGYFTSYLYINYLFTDISFKPMIIALLFYLVWALFIVSFTTMCSAIINSQAIIAIISIIFLLGCRIFVGLFTIFDVVNPASMSKHAMVTLITGEVRLDAWVNLFLTFLLVLLTLYISIYWISNKKYNHE